MAGSEEITDEWILDKLAQSFASMTDHAVLGRPQIIDEDFTDFA